MKPSAPKNCCPCCPQSCSTAIARSCWESDGEVRRIVKAADKLSAHIKCMEELKAGNQEFESAARQTRQALEEMHLPELDYFMKYCLDSFALNLDHWNEEDIKVMRAIVTVVGPDRVGIIAEVCGLLARLNINIIDISQTVMEDFFHHDHADRYFRGRPAGFDGIADALSRKGEEMQLSIRVQREDILTPCTPFDRAAPRSAAGNSSSVYPS